MEAAGRTRTSKDLVLHRAGTASRLADDAGADGLLVHVRTLCNENRFVATDLSTGTDPNASGDAFAEGRAFLGAGVDRYSTDRADTGVAVRDDWLSLAQAS